MQNISELVRLKALDVNFSKTIDFVSLPQSPLIYATIEAAQKQQNSEVFKTCTASMIAQIKGD